MEPIPGLHNSTAAIKRLEHFLASAQLRNYLGSTVAVVNTHMVDGPALDALRSIYLNATASAAIHA